MLSGFVKEGYDQIKALTNLVEFGIVVGLCLARTPF